MKDWFKELTGFAELGYEETRSLLRLDGQELISTVNGASYQVGNFELRSVESLRRSLLLQQPEEEPSKAKFGAFNIVRGDVKNLITDPQNKDALFQVASQFNCLEMVHPSVTPEDGVTRYQSDPTQGPACSIAAGAATIFRNYFVETNGLIGQQCGNQLDGLRPLIETIAEHLDVSPETLYKFQNGYVFFKADALEAIDLFVANLDSNTYDLIVGRLSLGLQTGAEVTLSGEVNHTVSQIFCSALPIGYNRSSGPWERFARLVLDAVYEGTFLAAQENKTKGGSSRLYLTLVGGGVFRNQISWILDSIERSYLKGRAAGLEVFLVSFSHPSLEITKFEQKLQNLFRS